VSVSVVLAVLPGAIVNDDKAKAAGHAGAGTVKENGEDAHPAESLFVTETV
jgi:hypothetical protein